MKKIYINGRFLIHRITGVERFAIELLDELDKLISYGEMELVIPPEVEVIPNYKNIVIHRVGKLHNILWEHLSFPWYVIKNKGISLNLCNVAPLLFPGIVCIFDMKIKVHPEFFSKKFLIWYNILFFNATRRGKLIITDSIAAKNDILKYYPRLKDKNIRVVYPGWQHYARIGCDENALEKYSLKKNQYFFSMGSMEPNKNFKWIAEIASSKPEYIFAVSGSINKDIFSDGLGFYCPKNMKLLGYTSDEEAKVLMRECKAFLFPTIYEGFGIPPLEAMSAGACHVIVSDTEVMHEIFENAVTYINPLKSDFDISRFAQHQNSVTDPCQILKKFSWEKSARELLYYLKDLNI